MEKMHTKKFVIGFLIVSIITIAVSCSILSWIEMRITTVDVKDMVIGNKENGIKYCIDDVYYTVDGLGDKTIYASGWCVKKKHPAGAVAIHALIRNNKTDTYYKLPTTIIERKDVTDSLDDGTCYDYSGFEANVKCNNFDFD